MAKKLVFILFTAILFLTFNFNVSAKDLETGTYSVDYTVLKEGESSTSIANDYFIKPAKLIIKDTKPYIEIIIGKSNWTKKVTINKSKEYLVSDNADKDQRTVQFALKDISEKQQGTVDVYIDEEVDGEDFLYDNSYGIQFVFKEESIKKLSSTPDEVKIEVKKENKKNETTFAMRGLAYGLIAVVVLVFALVIIRRMRGRKK
ncbi:NEAT domain-containing protein [Kurthia sibirica]|uniref:NEAT domain-containing protein n=1 Tax=Kurthia sibirica TaxID=202750 RepID=UPI00116D0E73|nr:NEAT domain-containing protein [Kurthia sibirica]GEK33831.1 hypothetical protein KSI01_13640 [Kurthia sibirica]